MKDFTTSGLCAGDPHFQAMFLLNSAVEEVWAVGGMLPALKRPCKKFLGIQACGAQLWMLKTKFLL